MRRIQRVVRLTDAERTTGDRCSYSAQARSGRSLCSLGRWSPHPQLVRRVTRITTSLGKGSYVNGGTGATCNFCWKTAQASGTSVSLSRDSTSEASSMDSYSGSASSLTWSHTLRSALVVRYNRCRQHSGSCECAVLWLLRRVDRTCKCGRWHGILPGHRRPRAILHRPARTRRPGLSPAQTQELIAA